MPLSTLSLACSSPLCFSASTRQAYHPASTPPQTETASTVRALFKHPIISHPLPTSSWKFALSSKAVCSPGQGLPLWTERCLVVSAGCLLSCQENKVPPTAVLVMKKWLQKLCFEVKTGRKGWQRQEAIGALLSVWIRASSILPVQELGGMARQHTKPERIRTGKQCQAVSLCPNRVLQWPVTGA